MIKPTAIKKQVLFQARLRLNSGVSIDEIDAKAACVATTSVATAAAAGTTAAGTGTTARASSAGAGEAAEGPTAVLGKAVDGDTRGRRQQEEGATSFDVDDDDML